MAHHPRRPAHEDVNPKFWLLFFLALVIVLVLFRAFLVAVEGMGGFRSGRVTGGEIAAAKTKKRRREKNAMAGPRSKQTRAKDAESHLD